MAHGIWNATSLVLYRAWVLERDVRRTGIGLCEACVVLAAIFVRRSGPARLLR